MISETLDSVAEQTYPNWECIVVDDGSTDDTEQILHSRIDGDSRFQFHRRPTNRPKGANACRNYGLGVSKGVYVNWYDSDDIMLPTNIEVKVNILSQLDCDYVVTKSCFYFGDGARHPEGISHAKSATEPNLRNFALEKIFWVTDDVMYTRKSVSEIVWNEILQSGQEFNFNCKYLERDPNGVLVDEVVSLLRRHPESIQGRLTNVWEKWRLDKFNVFFQTCLELSADKFVKSNLLVRSMNYYLQMKRETRPVTIRHLLYPIFKNAGIYEIVVIYLMILSKVLFNRYHIFHVHLLRRLR